MLLDVPVAEVLASRRGRAARSTINWTKEPIIPARTSLWAASATARLNWVAGSSASAVGASFFSSSVLDRLGDLLQIGIGAPFGGQSRDLDLDHEPGLDEVVGDALHQRLLELGDLDILLRRALGDEDALAMADLDEAEQSEAVQRLAHRRAPDTQAFHQLTLGGNPGPGGEIFDRVGQLLPNGLRELAPRNLGQSEIRLG